MADKKKWPQAARDKHYGKSGGGGKPGKKNLGRVIDETDPNLGYRDRRPGSVPDMLKVKARQNFTFGGGYSATGRRSRIASVRRGISGARVVN